MKGEREEKRVWDTAVGKGKTVPKQNYDLKGPNVRRLKILRRRWKRKGMEDHFTGK